ncbi:MAG: radical SAM protein, partial [Pirellulaceae bacterium]
MVSPGGNDRLVVGMVQINGMSLTKHAAGATAFSFLPYSVGLLEAYARREWRDTLALEFLPPVYQRLPVQQAVDQLLDAHVVGFSTYVWNINLSLQIAQRLKELRPETLIILGGPQVPDRAESFLRRHPYVDVTCHGEGERVFSQLLSRARQRDWTDIPSISFLHADGRFETHAKAERIADLDILPSPYLEGTFDKLMALHPNDQWFPLWETNRGCPFKCTFCDWGSAIAGRVYRFDMERLQGEMEWFASRQVHFVYCCDANFGMLPRDLEIARMLVETKQKTGYPWWISVQN